MNTNFVSQSLSPLELRQEATTPSLPVGGWAKRSFDVLTAAAALVTLAPRMALIAILLKIWEGGPVLFKHPRVGFEGTEFHCLKFRSMATNSQKLLQELLQRDPEAAREWAETQKLRDDPRISRLGGFLRRSSLDELPQLLNILRGDMSVVGPRPVTQSELGRYGSLLDIYIRTRPGLTGLLQVSRTDDMSYETRVRLDAEYVGGQSLIGDLGIIKRTVGAVLRGQGAC